MIDGIGRFIAFGNVRSNAPVTVIIIAPRLDLILQRPDFACYIRIEQFVEDDVVLQRITELVRFIIVVIDVRIVVAVEIAVGIGQCIQVVYEFFVGQQVIDAVLEDPCGNKRNAANGPEAQARIRKSGMACDQRQ